MKFKEDEFNTGMFFNYLVPVYKEEFDEEMELFLCGVELSPKELMQMEVDRLLELAEEVAEAAKKAKAAYEAEDFEGYHAGLQKVWSAGNGLKKWSEEPRKRVRKAAVKAQNDRKEFCKSRGIETL